MLSVSSVLRTTKCGIVINTSCLFAKTYAAKGVKQRNQKNIPNIICAFIWNLHVHFENQTLICNFCQTRFYIIRLLQCDWLQFWSKALSLAHVCNKLVINLNTTYTFSSAKNLLLIYNSVKYNCQYTCYDPDGQP